MRDLCLSVQAPVRTVPFSARDLEKLLLEPSLGRCRENLVGVKQATETGEATRHGWRRPSCRRRLCLQQVGTVLLNISQALTCPRSSLPFSLQLPTRIAK